MNLQSYYTTDTTSINVNPSQSITYTTGTSINSQPIICTGKIPSLSFNNYDYFTVTGYQDPDDFKKVIEYKPGKVYGFIFNNNKEIKTICDPSDTFDFDFAFYLAAAKLIWSKELTLEGVINKANELKTIKKWVKRVEKAKKQFYKEQQEEIKAKQKEEEEKERHKKYIEKKKNRDKKRALQAQENLKNIISEAIKENKEGE